MVEKTVSKRRTWGTTRMCQYRDRLVVEENSLSPLTTGEIMDTQKQRHPAYGVAVFSRATGSPGRLFGSRLKQHDSFIVLHLHTAERSHDLGRDWIYPRKQLVKVYFSAAQFAQLLTTMNVGSGTACTIKYIDVPIPEVPEDVEVEHERVQADFEVKLKKSAKMMDTEMIKVEKILGKTNINKGDREKIKELMRAIQQEVHDNMPFQLESFQKAVESTTQDAKAEIDAMATGAIQKAGLNALQGQMEMKILTAKEDDTSGH